MPKNAKGKKRRNLGKIARRKLAAIMEKFGHQCYWCHKPLVILSVIQKTYIITARDHCTVTYLKDGVSMQNLIASVDHLVGVFEGKDTNDITNLVPACRICNEERGNRIAWEKNNGQSQTGL
jgi:hypothetical protein